MNPMEAAQLLAVANTLDPRMVPPSDPDTDARAKAWAATLADTMPLAFAVEYVTAHYATRTDALMPAHLNEAWKARRRADAEQAEREHMTKERGVPMPPHIRQQLQTLLSKRKVAE